MKPALGHRAKRWLYLVHRWIGIVTCLLFAIWFASGLVMIYVPYPALTRAERLAGLPAIDWRRVRIGPEVAERLASPAAPPRALRLEVAGSDPVWRIETADGEKRAFSAETGRAIPPVGAEAAMRTASAFAGAPAASVELLERDQWTVAGGYNKHRPLWRVRLAGPGGHDLYVSSRTGEVLVDTSVRERFWNWLGSVPHWIYPTVLRQDGAAWRQVVLWVSGPCILVAITGIWIGLLRARFGARRFKGGRVTPYHGWMLWHHVAGLVGGVTLTLWIFSGWLSVDPGRLFESPGIDPAARIAYAGSRRPIPVDPARLAEAAGAGVKRVELLRAAGRAWILLDRPNGSEVLDARSLRRASIDQDSLIAAAAQLVPDARIAAVERLTAPDLYWYDVGSLPQLPVLRIKFADEARTWIHLDPATGRLLDSIDRRGRIYRWAYDLFHKWDLNLLTLHRPAWDILLWLFSLVGLATSASGIWIGWRRLRGKGSRSIGQVGRSSGRSAGNPRDRVAFEPSTGGPLPAQPDRT